MRIVVTGATGFIGVPLTTALLAQGHGVRALARPGREHALAPGLDSVIAADLTEQLPGPGAFEGTEVIVHLAGLAQVPRGANGATQRYRRLNTEATQALAERAVHAGVKRFVFLSSTRIFGEGPFPKVLTNEDSPSPSEPYGESKWLAEQRLMEIAAKSALQVIVLRLPPVYGPGVKGGFSRLLRLIQTGLPLPFGGLASARSLLFVENLLAAVMAALATGSDFAENRPFSAYFVADKECALTPDIIRWLAEGMGRPARLWSMPVKLVGSGLSLIGRSEEWKRLTQGPVIDSSAFSRQFGYSPPWSLREGLIRTGRWYAGHPER